MRYEEILAKFNKTVDKLEVNINKLIEYEAMKYANEERKINGEPLAYTEEDFLKLLKKKEW